MSPFFFFSRQRPFPRFSHISTLVQFDSMSHDQERLELVAFHVTPSPAWSPEQEDPALGVLPEQTEPDFSFLIGSSEKGYQRMSFLFCCMSRRHRLLTKLILTPN